MEAIKVILSLYFILFLGYWVITAIIRKIKKNANPRPQSFKIAMYVFFIVFIVIIIWAYMDNGSKNNNLEPKEESIQKQDEVATIEQITINDSYDIEPIKIQLISGEIDHTTIRRFMMTDSNEFFNKNHIESIDSMDFMDCINLNIFSNAFKKDGKTDLAPIRQTCYNELKEGNPFKKAYRGTDPLVEYATFGNVIKNVSGGNFEIRRSGMKKGKDGTITLFVVWFGNYKKDIGTFGVTKMIKDHKTLENSFDIGEIVKDMESVGV